MAMERLATFSDEVTEGQSSVRVEEERIERFRRVKSYERQPLTKSTALTLYRS